MKRILCILFTLLMIVPLAGCGGGGGDKPAAATSGSAGGTVVQTEPETTKKTDGLPATNMNGFEMHILHDEGYITWAKTVLDAEETTGDLLNDAIYERNRAMEERFNCKWVVTGMNQPSKSLGSIVTSGDDTYDLIMVYCAQLLNCMQYLGNIAKLPHLDLEATYWNPHASTVFWVGDKRAALCGNYSLSYISGIHLVAFNKNLWTDLQIKESPYDLVREGKWTFDKMWELAKIGVADLDGDGVISVDKDRYGFADTPRSIEWRTMIGANYKMIEKDKDNLPYFAFPGNEPMISYFTHVIEVVNADPNVFGTAYTSITVTDVKFEEEKALLAGCGVINVEKLREVEFDFGLLPDPKKDEAQEQYYTCSNAGEVLTLPLSANPDHLDYTGIIMEALSFASEDTIIPAYKEIILKSRYARDEESSEMLDICFSTITFEMGYTLFTNDVYNKIISGTIQQKSSDIASVLATNKPVIEAKIADFIAQMEALE